MMLWLWPQGMHGVVMVCEVMDGGGVWSQAIHDRDVDHRAQLKRRPSTHTAIFSFEIFSTLIIAHCSHTHKHNTLNTKAKLEPNRTLMKKL